jgi:vanillate O-demethylase monooxygenase subunit
MGDPTRADESLIPFAVGPDTAGWNVGTSEMQVKTNYRLEIINLADLSHLTWVHENTVGGSRKYAAVDPEFELTPRGLNTRYWVRSVEPTGAARHLFPTGALFDMHFDIQHTIPCTWVMHFRIFTAGQATSGESDGELVLDTWTSQAVTPRDADSVDYYYSWGVSTETEVPGVVDMLREALDVAFREDAVMLEGQHERMREKPDFPMVNLPFDEGPAKMVWVLDELLREEAAENERTPGEAAQAPG